MIYEILYCQSCGRLHNPNVLNYTSFCLEEICGRSLVQGKYVQETLVHVNGSKHYICLFHRCICKHMTLSALFQKPEAQVYLESAKAVEIMDVTGNNKGLVEIVNSHMQMFHSFSRHVEYFSKPYKTDTHLETHMIEAKKCLEGKELDFFQKFPDCTETIFINRHKAELEQNLKRWAIFSKVNALLNTTSNENIHQWSDFCDKMENCGHQNDSDSGSKASSVISVEDIAVHME